MTSVVHQSQRGSRCLDSLRDHLQAEGLSKPDDGADDGQITGAGPQITHEPGVDLEHVHREGLEVGQDSVAGAEVVYGYLDPTSLSSERVV